MLDPETEFLASKQETGNEWELFKENVRPLKRGRNVALLNCAIKSTSDYQIRSSRLRHRRKAQPAEKLTAAYKKFITRSMRQLKAADDATENHLPARSFGTVLTKQTGNQPSESSDVFRKKMKPERTPGTALSIYKDNSSGSLMDHQSKMSKVDLKPWHSLGFRSERNKENTAIPSKWTSTKIPQRPDQNKRDHLQAHALRSSWMKNPLNNINKETRGKSLRFWGMVEILKKKRSF